MSEKTNVLDEVAGDLRRAGLSVRISEEAEEIHVGSELRGEDAPAAIVELRGAEVKEYLHYVAEHGPRKNGSVDGALGFLGTQVLESLISVHDGENNLTDLVFLRRGSDGNLSVGERRIPAEPPTLNQGDGPFMWTAERPDAGRRE